MNWTKHTPPETDTDRAIKLYQTDRSTPNAQALLSALDGPIRAAAKRYATDDPIAIGKAKRIVLDAIPRYDATKSSPATFVDRHVQGLQRWHTKRQTGGRIPVSAVQQRREFDRTTSALEEEFGRPPTLAEIRDRTGLTWAQVAKHRRPLTPQVASTLVGEADDPENAVELGDLVPRTRDPYEDAAELILPDLSARDQLIVEHTLGLAGAKTLGVVELARKLNVSPGLISQRRKYLQTQLDELVSLDPFGRGDD